MTKYAVSLTQNVKAPVARRSSGRPTWPRSSTTFQPSSPRRHRRHRNKRRCRCVPAASTTWRSSTPWTSSRRSWTTRSCFGQIAATNAISDIYAMGAEPRTARTSSASREGTLDIEVLGEISEGGGEKAREAGVVVIGGHSIIDEEVKYGMAVTGEIHPDRVIRNVGVQPGDALVLTKPLGTGIITTALKQRRATQESVDAAVTSMTTLNGTASRIMRNFAVHACSDVTGFALLGHSQEMAAGSEVTIVLESAALPLLPGAVQPGRRRSSDWRLPKEPSVSAGQGRGGSIRQGGACGDRLRSPDLGRAAHRAASSGRAATGGRTPCERRHRGDHRRPRHFVSGNPG